MQLFFALVQLLVFVATKKHYFCDDNVCVGCFETPKLSNCPTDKPLMTKPECREACGGGSSIDSLTPSGAEANSLFGRRPLKSGGKRKDMKKVGQFTETERFKSREFEDEFVKKFGPGKFMKIRKFNSREYVDMVSEQLCEPDPRSKSQRPKINYTLRLWNQLVQELLERRLFGLNQQEQKEADDRMNTDKKTTEAAFRQLEKHVCSELGSAGSGESLGDEVNTMIAKAATVFEGPDAIRLILRTVRDALQAPVLNSCSECADLVEIVNGLLD